MASNPKMDYQVFLFIFQKNSAMATLDLKEMGKFLLEGREKVCPFGCFNLAKLNWDSQQGRPFSLPSQRNFPIIFKSKVAIAEFFWKCKEKPGIPFWGLTPCPFPSLQKPVVKSLNYFFHQFIRRQRWYPCDTRRNCQPAKRQHQVFVARFPFPQSPR